MVRPYEDRRKGPDLWVRMLTWINMASGISLVSALFITAVAKPQVETFFDRFYNLRLRRAGYTQEDLATWAALYAGQTTAADAEAAGSLTVGGDRAGLVSFFGAFDHPRLADAFAG